MGAKTYLGDTQIKKIFKGDTKIKYVYLGDSLVYADSHVVTYSISSGNVVTKEIDDGADAIANAPTASLPGWTFVGWRTDTAANPAVLPSYTVLSDNVTLYAVFQRTIYMYFNGNGATGGSVATQSATQYYNNGIYTTPTFTIPK